jgi:hypothetical protein
MITTRTAVRLRGARRRDPAHVPGVVLVVPAVLQLDAAAGEGLVDLFLTANLIAAALVTAGHTARLVR